MAQYIDKFALVEEIDKRQEEEVSYDEDCSFASWADHNHYSTLESIKEIINTLEVKEVDLAKEIANQYESIYKDYLLYYEEFADIAKHFFELGINAQKGK